MTPLLALAARSAWNRRFALGLVVGSITLSTALLLAIERLRQDVRQNFSQAVSGTDLVVGARTGPVPLLLYAVFHLGTPTHNIRHASVQALAKHRAVAWVVPLSLGDSHHGFAVLGTDAGYFEHVRYADHQPLVLAQGRRFEALFDCVIGADVARQRAYRLGQRVVLSHGDGALEANDHADQPFTITGILARTGTPVDRTLLVGLPALQAMHLDWAGGVHLPGVPGGASVPGVPAGAGVPGGSGAARSAAPVPVAADLTPTTITAALVGLKNRAAVFAVQRDVAAFRDEPLLAILPGVALDELWDVVALGERGLQAASVLVAVVSLAGLVAVILAGLNERRRELAILRAVGAGPRQVLLLLALEGALVTSAGVALGAAACWGAVAGLGPWVQAQWGITLRLQSPGSAEWAWLASLLAAGWAASLLPGWRAYHLSLADGLSPRI